ncbi:MAG: ribosome small subunit-dependent GTPase A [Lentimicrobiaceae bacterium]|jgi:ribosome biogenesis GTPase|nr:ribosome small subunit-dependent GTPase A [Lentimicrobiaceae bacterium]
MLQGIVIKSTGSWYTVQDENGKFWECRLRGKIRLEGIRSTNPIAVGDNVVFEQEAGKETAVIKNMLPRHNLIVRKATRLSKASHIIAANIDQAIVIVTIDFPRTSTGFIDRFLATAEAYHIPSLIVFNKYDLYDATHLGYLNKLMHYYNAIGYESFAVSAATGYNLEKLKTCMTDRTSLLSGHSGVGKSTLINLIEPSLNLKTGEISHIHNKGKHTTTFAEMHLLSDGGRIVDTPGIKEFGLYDLEKETLAQRFPEMRERMSECRYANCTHIHEPDCAVKKAVDEGKIASWRYTNYLNMMSGQDTNENNN